MTELYHVIPGRITEETYGYWGPDLARYNADANSVPEYGQDVDILWQEGIFYYIEYRDSANIYKRTYYLCDCVEVIGVIAPTEHEVSDDIINYRYVIADPVVESNTDLNVRYAPNSSAPVAGSLSTLERVNFIATVDGFSLVDYEVSNSNGKRKRAWIQNDRIAALPFPTDELYAKTQRNGYIGETNVEINARYFYDCFIALGFTPQAACALLGNIHQECSMNPAKWVINSKTDVDVYGIFQWDAASKYLNRAVQHGLITTADITSIKAYVRGDSTETVINDPEKIAILIMSQIECMIWQSITGTEWGNPLTWGYCHHSEDAKYMAFREFSCSTKSAQELSMVFLDHFERASIPDTKLRKDYAEDFYELFA